MDIFKLPVFPAANVFPMMTEEELAELAADIKANGQREPVVTAEVDDVTQLIDGRNRRAACKIAGVKPTSRDLNSEDPLKYVDSTELRRHVTPSQRAMGYAIRHPEPEKGGRGKKRSDTGQFSGVSKQRVSEARQVLDHSEDLAEAVVCGDKFLNEALTEARLSQGKLKNASRRKTKLLVTRPDLAEKVDAETMSLEDALKQESDEIKEQRDREWAATKNMITAMNMLDYEPEYAAERALLFSKSVAEADGVEITPERIRKAATYLTAYATAMENSDETPET